MIDFPLSNAGVFFRTLDRHITDLKKVMSSWMKYCGWASEFLHHVYRMVETLKINVIKSDKTPFFQLVIRISLAHPPDVGMIGVIAQFLSEQSPRPIVDHSPRPLP